MIEIFGMMQLCRELLETCVLVWWLLLLLLSLTMLLTLAKRTQCGSKKIKFHFGLKKKEEETIQSVQFKN